MGTANTATSATLKTSASSQMATSFRSWTDDAGQIVFRFDPPAITETQSFTCTMENSLGESDVSDPVEVTVKGKSWQPEKAPSPEIT